MSERILQALMQLFAIIARPESNTSDRRLIVDSFLKQQLNYELVDKYLEIFDYYYDKYQKRGKNKSRINTHIAFSSVRVLKICTEINNELIKKQKVIVVIRLLEFIKAENYIITDQELEFVQTVAETFHITKIEYDHIRTFVINSIDKISDSSSILVIDDNSHFGLTNTHHLYVESIKGQIRVLQIEDANMYVMRYFGESEIYLNGQLVQFDKVHVLSSGASIRNSKIKPIYYSDIISRFNADKITSTTVFEVHDLEYIFKNGKKGLNEINFSERSGKLIGIMGGSGAGKSTLLHVLNGSNAPSKGEVLVNGINIHTESHEIEGVIGFVSQDDLLIEELTVFQNLYYNAKLCFDNYNQFQILRAVLKLLKNLGLYEIRNMKVGSPLNKKISGGQRKRLNIALELIREPTILFLDEPTSGLSSRDSENILDLLKELTLKGKLVFVVIHQPSSDIFKMFDKLLILDQGGYLIYNGDPVDSIIYFKSRIGQADWNDSECRLCGNVNPEQVFNIVESKVVDEYGDFTQTRKVSPKQWYSYFTELNRNEEDLFIVDRFVPDISFKIPKRLKQFWIFVKRDVLSKLANTQYLVINILETPLLAFFLAFLIKYYNVDPSNKYGYVFNDNTNMPVYIFMSVIVALFIGLTVSAEEIIKDKKILKREAFLNLSRSSYLMSKIAILFTLASFQALVFVLVGNSILEIKGMYFRYWLILFTTWNFAIMLGLNISDSFKTSVTIYILIPFLIIPQIILSGILVKFDKLNPNVSSPSHIPWYGEIMTARWAYEALAVYQFKSNKYGELFYPYDKIISQCDYKKNFWLTNVQNKINDCERFQGHADKQEQIIYNLNILSNEIKKEAQENTKVLINANIYNRLYMDSISQATIDTVQQYFEKLRKYYIDRRNKASDAKDALIAKLEKEDMEQFRALKRNYRNEQLEKFVTNSDDLTRLVEYNGKLYQKTDPIYQDPQNPFIFAHFYTPYKQLFGIYIDTYWINFGIIWLMTITLYISLYFRGLKHFLELSDYISTELSLKEQPQPRV